MYGSGPSDYFHCQLIQQIFFSTYKMAENRSDCSCLLIACLVQPPVINTADDESAHFRHD